jgi:chitosanase
MISEDNKRLIQRVVNVFETGTPAGKYDSLVVMADGLNKSRQITFGRSQTTEQGNLRKLLLMYLQNNGTFKDRLSAYMDRVGMVPLADDEVFKGLLVAAARDDEIMRTTQDKFFDLVYYNPAMEFFNHNEFALPLSLLVIYDSYIHSGRVPDYLRKRFGEFVPAAGGNEQKWTSSYVDIRHQWLKYHPNELLRKTIYRTQCFKDQIAADNWNLDKLPLMANNVAIG